jgi:hypothetical protein
LRTSGLVLTSRRRFFLAKGALRVSRRLLGLSQQFDRVNMTPTNESAPERQERLMDVSPFFITDAQAAKLIQPSEGSLHHPSPSPQSAAMLGVAFGQPRHDVASTQTFPNCLRVITPVA